MSEDIELLGFQIEKGLIPTTWLKVSYPTCKPLGPYVDDLVNRLKYIKGCCSEGVGRHVWLGGLFQPQALLVSALGDHSRVTHTPVHLLSWDHCMEPPSPGDSGLLVSGLLIHGARWNSALSILEDQPPREFISKMPEIWFKPILKSERKEESRHRYSCPLYETADRANYVAHVLIPSQHSPAHWIYRGVVLLCQ
ncbi:dynein axonemal heavy chain 12-like [Macrosteles quadrilineatus]|uniref:dynein axonemal heavy chain 12-like n=1 Tax=Macrosteles quadrilineatus TaxID=74068 RepID=UPI0023E1154D|nr:dynein axonemal heavy chain 12-like [Macrosteles quadrilineatus]